MERCKVAYAQGNDPGKVLRDLANQLHRSDDKKPVLMIISADHDNLVWLSKELYKLYSDAVIIGASTFVSFSKDKNDYYAASVMAIYSGIQVSFGVLKEVNKNPMKYRENIERALSVFSDYSDMCCIEFVNAYTLGEELVMDAFRGVLEKHFIPIFGGTAAPSKNTNDTLITLNGVVYDNACVFVLIKNLNGGLFVTYENMFEITDRMVTATDVDCNERKVYEFEYMKAADAIAESSGITKDKLDEYVHKHPLGRLEGDRLYVTDFNQVYPDGSISFYARIYNYTPLYILERLVPQKIWKDTRDRVYSRQKKPSFSIIINCISRTSYYMDDGIFDEYVSRMNEYYCNYIGFVSNGEQFDYEHLNQTMLIVAFE